MKAKTLTCIIITLLLFTAFFIPNNIHVSGLGPVTRTIRIPLSSVNYGDFGSVYGRSTNYSEARVTASFSSYELPGHYVEVGQWNDSGTYEVYRAFLKFNTQNMPSDAVISAARLSFFARFGNYAVERDFILRIRKWTGDTPIDEGDFNQYDNINYDNGGFHAIDAIEGWNNVTISNFNIINIGGYTKMCLIASTDLAASPPPARESLEIYYGQYPVYLEITYTYTPARTVVPRWLIGGHDGRIVAIDSDDGANQIDLTNDLATTLDIEVIENGFGYYLIGLTDYRTLGVYDYPADVPRLYKYDGVSFTPIGANGIQIMDICKTSDRFWIAAWEGGGGIPYGNPKIYTYDGATLRDVTDQIMGSFQSKYRRDYGNLFTTIEDCGSYLLIGAAYFGEGEVLKYDKTTGKVTELFVPPYSGWYGISPPTTIEWNGEFAIIGLSGDYSGVNGTGSIFKYDGTTLTPIQSTGWTYDAETNSTSFLLGGEYGAYIYANDTITPINDTVTWYDVGWNGMYWLLGGECEGATQLWRLDVDGNWQQWSIDFTPYAIAPGAFKVQVTSEPEVHARFSFHGATYTTPALIACYPGSYNFGVIDVSKTAEDNIPVVFTYIVYEASPPQYIYSAATTVDVNNDANITIVYGSGQKREQVTPIPEETENMFCLPLTFYIILVFLFIFALYLFAQRETWKISIPLVAVILWLLILEPKTPIDQMPIAILRQFIVPPWHLYMAVILAIVACAALLTKKK